MELCLKLNYCSAGKVEENRCHDYCICKGDSLLHLRALCNPQPPHCLLSLEAPNVTSITPVPFVHFILAGVNKGSETGRDLGDAEHHVASVKGYWPGWHRQGMVVTWFNRSV